MHAAREKFTNPSLHTQIVCDHLNVIERRAVSSEMALKNESVVLKTDLTREPHNFEK